MPELGIFRNPDHSDGAVTEPLYKLFKARVQLVAQMEKRTTDGPKVVEVAVSYGDELLQKGYDYPRMITQARCVPVIADPRRY